MASFVDLILGEVGKPYIYGGDTPAGFDCSGLGYWAAGVAGISGVPRTSQQMFAALPRVSSPEVGDFIFFDNGSGNQQPDHVAYVVDPDRHLMVSADHPGATIQVESWDGWGPVVGFGRLPGAGAGSTIHAQTVGFNPTDPSTWGLDIPNLNPLDAAGSAVGDLIAAVPAAFLRVIFGDHTMQEIALRSMETVWGAIILATGVVMIVKVIAKGGEPGRAAGGARQAAGTLVGGYAGARTAVKRQGARTHRGTTNARRAARPGGQDRPPRDELGERGRRMHEEGRRRAERTGTSNEIRGAR